MIFISRRRRLTTRSIPNDQARAGLTLARALLKFREEGAS